MEQQNITIDELAGIIKNEFDNVNKQFDNVNKQLKELKQGHENIELRLANVAYRFELEEVKEMVKILRKQVETLNVKAGL